MHPAPLARLCHVLQAHVDQGVLPGAVALVHHQGRTVLHQAVGAQRPGADAPAMEHDTLFRIYSMTKPIASLVALMLMEEGRLLLAHPVSHYLPAFAGQQVYDPATGQRAPAPREATVHDLLRHTAGLSYAWEAGPVPDLYRAARIGSRRHTNAGLAAALGPLPLVHAPGSRWEYSRATDVLGAVLEVVEGAPLGTILQRRVFGPLGMHDTGFSVPPRNLHRLAEPFARDPQTGTEVALIDVAAPPAFESAGGGLVSTAADYARFLQLLLGRGTLEGTDGPVRLASRATVDFMTADHLGGIPTAGDVLPPGYGFGLGVAVRTATGQATRPGSAGHYSWSGLGGTFFLVDPAQDLFAILLTQAPGQLRYLSELYPALVYAAL
ncbi:MULTISPECIES: serine hydrolase [unclassified Acidovorax]|uniref:serine hydrolase domain-containing protein n=1 Tax=unclassified Acidovorax TaxID=2684926 RepID=UPI001C4849AE|nr:MULTISPECIES: serine hydrolase domain-containing protein [unclassified Acidovorax]MBV7429575.1 beta-lactamase family protein [Acidovorax sp. sif0732]MBV7448653.1 beta-lactamase family protein [Acidovorax sp. sif0715]